MDSEPLNFELLLTLSQLSDANNQVDDQTEWIKVDESELNYDHSSPYDYQESHADVELTEEQRERAAMIGKAIAEGTIGVLNEVVALALKSGGKKR